MKAGICGGVSGVANGLRQIPFGLDDPGISYFLGREIFFLNQSGPTRFVGPDEYWGRDLVYLTSHAFNRGGGYR